MYDKTHNYLNFRKNRKNIKGMLAFIFLWVLSPQRKMNASMLQVKKFLAFACLSLFQLIFVSP